MGQWIDRWMSVLNSGIEFSNSNPWHGGNKYGGQKKKRRYFSHYCVRIPDNVRGIFHSTDTLVQDQLLSEHPNRDPALIFFWICVEATLPTMPGIVFLWYEITLLVWTGRVWYMLVCWIGLGCWWHYPDHGMRFYKKVNVLGSESSQCSGHLGEDSMDVYQVLEHAVSLTGAVSWLVVSAHSCLKLWIPGQLRLLHLLGIYLTALILVSLPLTRF